MVGAGPRSESSPPGSGPHRTASGGFSHEWRAVAHHWPRKPPLGTVVDVGVDDEEAGTGADLIFQGFADNAKVADSGVLTPSSPVSHLTADVTGATWLRLHVDPDDPNSWDHGDWAAPQLTCTS